MYLTKGQKRALWFVLFFVTVSIFIKYVRYYFYNTRTYDFSEFDKMFESRRDSLLQIIPQDSFDESYGHDVKISQEGVKDKDQQVESVVNINTADIILLQRLPQIGPKTAERILRYRNENGPFKTKEDIMKVKGIGKKKFEGIKDLIILE